VTTSFGSPTIWKIVGEYCRQNDIKLPSLQRILMAGAPVPPWLIEEYHSHILNGGQVFTPFGATEALPVSTISGAEILAETAALTAQGWGVCVGQPMAGLNVRVIAITDEMIAQWDDSLALPTGELGEIVVKGPVVTRIYLHRPEQTAQAKIYENGDVWHRMGDTGYFDSRGRLWMCGRKAHRVETAEGLLLPVPCEAIFNAHADVSRTALVGIGELGAQRPVLVVELKSGRIPAGAEKQRLIDELLALGREYEHTRPLQTFLFHESFPVDVRHNVKIQREKLAAWAAGQI
jgi:acyl-CoA synthetase (AMP-forming)/AMP-acid ligase II